MLNFLNPIWLFAAAAVIIPVVIHLWNIRPGKVLKVGSTSLIAAASRRSSRSFKILDVLLLIIRCLLLILLAILLAKPFMEKQVQQPKATGWVLLPQGYVQQGYGRYKQSIDSLLKKGYSLRYFNPGFNVLDTASLKVKLDTVKVDTANISSQNYWSLLGELNSKVDTVTPVYLFTPNTQTHFKGEKPAVDLNLHWQTFTPADSTSQWIQDAWMTTDRNVRVLSGNSSPSGISYQYTTLKNDGENKLFNVSVQNGQPVVTLKGANSAPFKVDTAVYRMAIYADAYTADAAYLSASLDAVNRFTGSNVILKTYDSPNAIPANTNWIFWLSDRPFSARLLHPGLHVFAYQKGIASTISSTIISNLPNALPGGDVQVPLFKSIKAAANTGDVIWHDGFGQPVLTGQQQHNAYVYHFFSRFNPTWNNLPWDGQFPQLLLQLTAKLQEVPMKNDKRVLQAAEITPLKGGFKAQVSTKEVIRKEATQWIWLVLVLLFITERWLATQSKTIQSNG
ncbi:BatA domain-containing protein [Mucilaginibacter sp. RS28]|uniref:BatA domain-containing protein n=1 Tax=Mucilaginibacter straminoryzae TaxID=2932774 RepID=A0A9X2BCM5_9SPHI|nr:BatA domain-containing protein [Mucilaginibacter straminoryzae]MCJ8209478.1 BatA domain-containing protein [Mucilaginibacter straminoryzae]